MRIRGYLQGKSFDPEAIGKLDIAFITACKALGLADVNDAVTEVVANRVIEVASTGEDNPERLATAVLRSFYPRGY
jgi:hypothetical protein